MSVPEGAGSDLKTLVLSLRQEGALAGAAWPLLCCPQVTSGLCPLLGTETLATGEGRSCSRCTRAADGLLASVVQTSDGARRSRLDP